MLFSQMIFGPLQLIFEQANTTLSVNLYVSQFNLQNIAQQAAVEVWKS